MTDTRDASQDQLVESRDSATPTNAGESEDLDDFRARVRAAVDDLAAYLGEDRIGGRRHPPKTAFHRRDQIEIRAEKGLVKLKAQLKKWSAESEFGPVGSLYVLWEQTYEVLQVTLAYDTLRVVKEAARQVFKKEIEEPRSGGSTGSWDSQAISALSEAMDLITNDGELFKLVNTSDAAGLKEKAVDAAQRATEISSRLKPLLTPPAHDGSATPQFVEALAIVAGTADQLGIFYGAGACAADAVLEFENWLERAPILDLPTHDNPSASRADLDEINDKIETAKGHLAALGGGDLIERISEPWGRMLVEIQEITKRVEEPVSVFVPNRVEIWYFYPFAVDSHSPYALQPPWGDSKTKALLATALDSELGKLNISCGGPTSLGESQFFNRGTDRYGGVRVELRGGIKLQHLPAGNAKDAQEMPCRVWLELSDMGNHCLCIAPGSRATRHPLTAPRPPELYRAVRAGTPFVIGETVVIGQPLVGDPTWGATTGEPANPTDLPSAVREAPLAPDDVTWDNLHLFSRDVVAAVARGLLGREAEVPEIFEENFEPGNLHEVLVVKTNAPPNAAPRAIEAALDASVGGRILLRSTHQAASSLAEWVRYPSAVDSDRPLLAENPVVGFAGDWFANTGEMTVFGFVATPPWQTDVYAEAARFASSWSPLLRLWSRRMQDTIEASSSADQIPTQKSQPDAEEAVDAEVGGSQSSRLRRVERQVRIHLMQISAEDLCATRAHRRFLDQLLQMAQLNRLQEELENQLVATERLIDWDTEDKRRRAEEAREEADERRTRSEHSRNVLLTVLTLLGIFGLSGFLADLHKDVGHRLMGLYTVPPRTVIDDDLLLVLFAAGVLVALWYGMFGDWRAFLMGRFGDPKTGKLFARGRESRRTTRTVKAKNPDGQKG